jgi:uncharacterized GH25 family protein
MTQQNCLVSRMLAITGLFLSAFSTGVIAHETWLLPESFDPEAGASATLLMTSGMAFPALDSGISPVRIKEAVLSQNGERSLLVPAGGRVNALELSAAPKAGTACAWVVLNPRILEIKADAVAHYLEEIGAGDAVWTAWEAQPEPRQWRESYSKLARTYLRGAGESGGEACWTDKSIGRFEILPLADPTSLAAGDTLQLQLLFDDEPLARQAVGLVRAGDAPNALAHSNAEGILTLSFASAGQYMIYATNLRAVAGDGFNWQSDFTTLTLQVGSTQ